MTLAHVLKYFLSIFFSDLRMMREIIWHFFSPEISIPEYFHNFSVNNLVSFCCQMQAVTGGKNNVSIKLFQETKDVRKQKESDLFFPLTSRTSATPEILAFETIS